MSAALALTEEVPTAPKPKVDRYGIEAVPGIALGAFVAATTTTTTIDVAPLTPIRGMNFDNYIGEKMPAGVNTLLNDAHTVIDSAGHNDRTVVIGNTGVYTMDSIANNTITYNTTATTITGNVEFVNNGGAEVMLNLNGRAYPIRIPAGQRYIIDTEGTYTTTTGSLIYSNSYVETKAQKFLRDLRAKMVPAVKSRQKPLRKAIPGPELKARQTLREMILESEWRRYLTNGFIMVQGQSGKWYQVFNDMRRIQVYENNKLINRLCIYTTNDCPPTDHVINMKLLAELDEERLWSGSNAYPITPGNEYGQNNPNNQYNTEFPGNLIVHGNLNYQVDTNGSFASVA